MNKTLNIRKFFKRLPKNTCVDSPFIQRKFGIANSTAFHLLKNLVNEQQLKTQFRSVIRDNGKTYIVRVYFKP